MLQGHRDRKKEDVSGLDIHTSAAMSTHTLHAVKWARKGGGCTLICSEIFFFVFEQEYG